MPRPGRFFRTLPAIEVFAGSPSVESCERVEHGRALFPVLLASVVAYRDDFRPFELVSLRVLLMVSLVGGLVGAFCLLADALPRRILT